MKITGIICEYNPLHLGHKKQLDAIKAKIPDGGIVCLMSGNYVQRGTPAIFDKMVRAKAALLTGADLVLELPITAALSSAEGFAAAGVRILSPFCDELCFGAENADTNLLMNLARTLLSQNFPEALRTQLDKGLSFPAARQAALSNMGTDASALAFPNNILAIEYCKAILAQNAQLIPHVILRQGDYHDCLPDRENPSATSLRSMIESKENWSEFTPQQVVPLFENATIHTVNQGERAILAKLRTMTDAEFETLPFGSEGLWRKLMHAARQETTLADILAATKSKRYTQTRLNRMVLCAFLGITEQMLSSPAPYVRVLALNDKGRQILKTARTGGCFINIGEKQNHPYQDLEDRCSALYGLFSATTEKPNTESEYRVFDQK